MKTIYTWMDRTTGDFMADLQGVELAFNSQDAAIDYVDADVVARWDSEGRGPEGVVLVAYDVDLH